MLIAADSKTGSHTRPEAGLVPKPAPVKAAEPLIDFPVSPAARKIAEVLFNRKVCIALDNNALENVFGGRHTMIDYDKSARIQITAGGEINPALLDCQMTITDCATLVRMLPKLTKDVLVLNNPIDIAADPAALRTGLETFRKANPEAVVVSAMPSGDAISVGLAGLEIEVMQRDGLVDSIGKKNAATNELMYQAALLVEQKTKTEQKVHGRWNRDSPLQPRRCS